MLITAGKSRKHLVGATGHGRQFPRDPRRDDFASSAVNQTSLDPIGEAVALRADIHLRGHEKHTIFLLGIWRHDECSAGLIDERHAADDPAIRIAAALAEMVVADD